MQKSRKPFTIEQQHGRAAPEADMPGAAPRGGLQEVLGRLDDIGAMLQPAQSIIQNIAEAYRREVEEVLNLRQEMSAIQEAIAETKRHVVAFHAAPHHAVTVNHAAGELGAVVLDTEGATNNILAAAEKIEMLAGVIQSEKTKEAMKLRAGDIANHVMAVYEACNFQDLTGQRINRVCETLNFVEKRVNRMAEVWGGLDSLSGIMAQEIENLQSERDALGTHALAAGPAVVGAQGHVDQNEIDALFD